MRTIAWRALLVWWALLLVAVLNGALREVALVPALGPRSAHVLSTLMLSAAIFAIVYALIPWIRPDNARAAGWIGAGWLALTLAFELGFGRLSGKSWSDLLADYDVLAGRIWILVLVVTATSPLLTARLRHVIEAEGARARVP
jgi:purine-cytosine permease-like protein